MYSVLLLYIKTEIASMNDIIIINNIKPTKNLQKNSVSKMFTTKQTHLILLSLSRNLPNSGSQPLSKGSVGRQRIRGSNSRLLAF